MKPLSQSFTNLKALSSHGQYCTTVQTLQISLRRKYNGILYNRMITILLDLFCVTMIKFFSRIFTNKTYTCCRSFATGDLCERNRQKLWLWASGARHY